MSTINSVCNSTESKLASPHQDTHTHICHQDSMLQPYPQTPTVHLNVPSIADLLSLRFHILHKFWFFLTHASNRPMFPYFPKIGLKEDLPTLSTESTSRQHKSSHASNRPCFHTSPKLAQKKLSQLCPPNPPQGNTCPPLWSDLDP
jgi:hypothetical protein